MAHPVPDLVLYPVDMNAVRDGIWNEPTALTHPYPYRFKINEEVWIRPDDGNWYRGRVVRSGMASATKMNVPGLYFEVEYRLRGPRIRKWYAPLNGDIKPDTEQVHAWLLQTSPLWPAVLPMLERL